MKRILGALRRADEKFALIQPGDHIMVGVSGGKDSLVMVKALALYQKFSRHPFTLHAVMLGMGLEPLDTAPLEDFCSRAQVPFLFKDTNIGQVVFHERQEKNPCSLCARMRRAVLVETAHELGCGKMALGHHRDDVVETLLMSLLYEGRMRTFAPLTWLDRQDMVQIRPLIYAQEEHIAQVAQAIDAPITKNPCPASGHTARQEVKEALATLQKLQPRVSQYILHALDNPHNYDLWDGIKYRPGEEPAGYSRE